MWSKTQKSIGVQSSDLLQPRPDKSGTVTALLESAVPFGNSREAMGWVRLAQKSMNHAHCMLHDYGT